MIGMKTVAVAVFDVTSVRNTTTVPITSRKGRGAHRRIRPALVQ
jgi:hypothetical protein